MTELPTSSPDLAAPRERDELLATKVTIPRTRPERVARARLFQRLDEGMAGRWCWCAHPRASARPPAVAHARRLGLIA